MYQSFQKYERNILALYGIALCKNKKLNALAACADSPAGSNICPAPESASAC